MTSSGEKVVIYQRPTMTRLIFNSNKYIIMPKVMWKIECSVCCFGQNTVKPVLNSTILRGHPLLSGHLTKSHNVLHSNTVKVTFIKWSSLLSRCGHPLHSPKVNYCFEPLLNSHLRWLQITQYQMLYLITISLKIKLNLTTCHILC